MLNEFTDATKPHLRLIVREKENGSYWVSLINSFDSGKKEDNYRVEFNVISEMMMCLSNSIVHTSMFDACLMCNFTRRRMNSKRSSLSKTLCGERN